MVVAVAAAVAAAGTAAGSASVHDLAKRSGQHERHERQDHRACSCRQGRPAAVEQQKTDSGEEHPEESLVYLRSIGTVVAPWLLS